MKFEAATVQQTKRHFGLFPRYCVEQAKETFERHFKDYRNEMRQRSTVGPLFKNTGRLGGSFDREVSGGVLSQLKASVFSRSSYSIVHESGGTMYPPVGSSWIFIPTVFNTRYTVRAKIRRAKFTVREVRSKGGDFFSIKALYHRWPHDTGTRLALMDFISKSLLVDATGVPMYTLWKRAHYEARLGFIETGAKYEQRIMDDLAKGQIEYWKPF